jgi:hypothetical protein
MKADVNDPEKKKLELRPDSLPLAKLIEFTEIIVISSVYQHQLMPSKTGGGA